MSHNRKTTKTRQFLYVSTLNSQTQLITNIWATLDDKRKAEEEKNEIKKRLLNIFFVLNNIFVYFFRVFKGRRMKALRYKVCVLNVNIEVKTKSWAAKWDGQNMKKYKEIDIESLKVSWKMTVTKFFESC